MALSPRACKLAPQELLVDITQAICGFRQPHGTDDGWVVPEDRAVGPLYMGKDTHTTPAQNSAPPNDFAAGGDGVARQSGCSGDRGASAAGLLVVSFHAIAERKIVESRDRARFAETGERWAIVSRRSRTTSAVIPSSRRARQSPKFRAIVAASASHVLRGRPSSFPPRPRPVRAAASQRSASSRKVVASTASARRRSRRSSLHAGETASEYEIRGSAAHGLPLRIRPTATDRSHYGAVPRGP